MILLHDLAVGVANSFIRGGVELTVLKGESLMQNYDVAIVFGSFKRGSVWN